MKSAQPQNKIDTQESQSNNIINDTQNNPQINNPVDDPGHVVQKDNNKTYGLLVFTLAIGLIGALGALKYITKNTQTYSASAKVEVSKKDPKIIIVPTTKPTLPVTQAPVASSTAEPIKELKDLQKELEELKQTSPEATISAGSEE